MKARRRVSWSLAGAAAASLAAVAPAGATHLGPLQVGHILTTSAPSGVQGALSGAVFRGVNTSGSGGSGAAGLLGSHSSTTGSAPGVLGTSSSTSDSAAGVLGQISPTTPGVGSAGVRGVNGGTGANGFGVVGFHGGAGVGVAGHAPQGIGVRGVHGATTGAAPGVQGDTNSAAAGATGVLGRVVPSAPGANSAAVRGLNRGTGAHGIGVWGSHAGGGAGVRGTSILGHGVLASSIEGAGVLGEHTATAGVMPGVEGTTSSLAVGSSGVLGRSPGNAPDTSGVRGLGFFGVSGDGVVGGRFTSNGGMGVVGAASGSDGVGVFGSASGGGYAGQFDGSVAVGDDLLVVGNLNVSGTKNFRIDHPLDPGGKYLQHAAVESDAPLNVYTGTVTTDAKGFATVRLPAYVDAVTKDPGYQLTLVGREAWGAQAVVWEELRGGRFVVRSRPGVKVSWEVTGQRDDRHLRAHPFEAEVEKTGRERGTYLHPELYGRPPALAAVPPRPLSGPRAR